MAKADDIRLWYKSLPDKPRQISTLHISLIYQGMRPHHPLYLCPGQCIKSYSITPGHPGILQICNHVLVVYHARDNAHICPCE
ncbi:hypothetical protein JTE90_003958 [Oedothorax gibbosus]|uniref:Uncharacterized protein n=1 Tax=Oedothorax gibbosus TaxID=931172 RepID=A0AAV6UXY2_9ARAC|nr:hypothetical protein JTE90_003958 [Oedothorax gibbosus]